MLLSRSLAELIKDNHSVRLVNDLMNIRKIKILITMWSTTTSTMSSQKSGKKTRLNPSDNLLLYMQQDQLCCPTGQSIHRIEERKSKNFGTLCTNLCTISGQKLWWVPSIGSCYKGKGNRVVEINYDSKRHQQKARQHLLSDQGLAHRFKRPWDVEATLAEIQHNRASDGLCSEESTRLK